MLCTEGIAPCGAKMRCNGIVDLMHMLLFYAWQSFATTLTTHLLAQTVPFRASSLRRIHQSCLLIAKRVRLYCWLPLPDSRAAIRVVHALFTYEGHRPRATTLRTRTGPAPNKLSCACGTQPLECTRRRHSARLAVTALGVGARAGEAASVAEGEGGAHTPGHLPPAYQIVLAVRDVVLPAHQTRCLRYSVKAPRVECGL